MLGRHHGVGHAEQGVGSGGEDPQCRVGPPSAPVRPSTSRSSSAPSERPTQFRCIVLTRSGQSRAPSRVEQLVGVRGDPEEPLLEIAPHRPGRPSARRSRRPAPARWPTPSGSPGTSSPGRWPDRPDPPPAGGGRSAGSSGCTTGRGCEPPAASRRPHPTGSGTPSARRSARR